MENFGYNWGEGYWVFLGGEGGWSVAPYFKPDLVKMHIS